MTWTPDPAIDEPQQHPDYPEVKFISSEFLERVSPDRNFSMCNRCALKGTCRGQVCGSGFFITKSDLVTLRLLGTL